MNGLLSLHSIRIAEQYTYTSSLSFCPLPSSWSC